MSCGSCQPLSPAYSSPPPSRKPPLLRRLSPFLGLGQAPDSRERTSAARREVEVDVDEPVGEQFRCTLPRRRASAVQILGELGQRLLGGVERLLDLLAAPSE